MDRSAINEINAIKSELNSIIRELDDISQGVRNNFTGIGSEQCSDCINSVISQYRHVKNRLDNMDTNKVTENFAKNLKV